MDENTNTSGKWFWAGIEFKDLPPVLKQKFVDSRNIRQNSFASIIKNGIKDMQPGDVRGFGPLGSKVVADRAVKRISNQANRMHWPEGYSCGVVDDDAGNWWASIMRKAEKLVIT